MKVLLSVFLLLSVSSNIALANASGQASLLHYSKYDDAEGILMEVQISTDGAVEYTEQNLRISAPIKSAHLGTISPALLTAIGKEVKTLPASLKLKEEKLLVNGCEENFPTRYQATNSQGIAVDLFSVEGCKASSPDQSSVDSNSLSALKTVRIMLDGFAKSAELAIQ